MEKGSGIPARQGFYGWLIRTWLALTRRKLRILHAGELTTGGAVVYAVGCPANFLAAVVMSLAVEPPVRCLLPSDLARGFIARFMARKLGMILYETGGPIPTAAIEQALDVLAGRSAVVLFADQDPGGVLKTGTLASTAAFLLAQADARHVGRIAALRPVHLFMPQPGSQSREILVYFDAVLARPENRSAPGETLDLTSALESRFRQNTFQLQPADVGYLLSDLESILQTSLQEEWASLPDWKQDIEGFGLSKYVVEWVEQTNYMNPARVVALRESVDRYRELERQCALRELELEAAGIPDSALRRGLLRIEAVLGLPVALYGLLNHLAIALILLAAGSFKQNSTRSRRTEWTLRGAVTLAFYAVQIYLVKHWWGRAAAGYYAPTLPISGVYLWRYWKVAGPRMRMLWFSLGMPGLKKKVTRLRWRLLDFLDDTLEPYEEKTPARD